MEVSKEKYKQMVVSVVRALKELDSEILAVRSALQSVKMAFKISGDNLVATEFVLNPEPLIQAARQTQQQMMDDKYEVPLARVLEQFDRSEELDEKFLELLRSWRPPTQVD